MNKKIVFLTGAGISAESGIQTFRGADGLWEGHNVMDVASPEGWARNMDLVLKFYNDRRRQLFSVEPNAAHNAITTLQNDYDVHVITQNVDDLHERAGNKQVIHLHGELRKARSCKNLQYEIEHLDDIHKGDLCPDGHQLRPAIVWFGEAVPMIETAVECISDADIVIIVGTSMKVYPAASLVAYAPADAQLYYVDPYPQINYELSMLDVRVIESSATQGLPPLVDQLLKFS